MPGEEVVLEFSVLPPAISGASPFVGSRNISITQVEDPNEDSEWYEHTTYYRINNGPWTEYTEPFTIFNTSTIDAKTVTVIDHMLNYTEIYEEIVHESEIVTGIANLVVNEIGDIDDEPVDEEIIEELETPLGAVTFNASFLQGYLDDTFKPHNDITRAELATIFARILALDTSNTASQFNDITGDEWYAGFINAAFDARVVLPQAVNMYGASDGITRLEFAMMVDAYWNFLGIEVEPLENGFADTEGLAQESMILKVVAQGVMSGYDDNMFMPYQFVTREQVAEMINTLLARGEVTPVIPTYKDVAPDNMYFGEIEAASTNSLLSE
jgi:hypothetical protein